MRRCDHALAKVAAAITESCRGDSRAEGVAAKEADHCDDYSPGEISYATTQHRLDVMATARWPHESPPLLMGEVVDVPLRGELRYGLELTRLVCDPAFCIPGIRRALSR
jgi:hypothetical protein